MRSSIIAAGLVGIATAAYAPAYYPESSTTTAPVYEATTPPAYESTSSTPVAPVYETSTSTTPEAPVYETSPPVYTAPPAYTTSTPVAPVYENSTTTESMTKYTTYCPEATTLTWGASTYTVSSATTLTITSCPGGCYETPSSAPWYSVPTWAPSASSPVPYSPVESSSWSTVPAPYYPTANATAPVYSPTGAATTGPATYTGAATKAVAGMVGVSGLFAAFFL